MGDVRFAIESQVGLKRCGKACSARWSPQTKSLRCPQIQIQIRHALRLARRFPGC